MKNQAIWSSQGGRKKGRRRNSARKYARKLAYLQAARVVESKTFGKK